MKSRFHDNVVWITGAGSGLGAEMARAFAREGAHLALSGRRVDRLDEVADSVRALGGKAMTVPCDVRDERAVDAAAEAIEAHFGRIDTVVANAGYSVSGRIETLGADAWRAQLETNVIGLTNTVRSSLPALRRTNGRLVLIGSVAGLVTTPGVGAYHASKFAVRAIGETLAKELHGSGVTCTTIHPGFVASEIARVDNKGVYDASRRDVRPHALMWQPDAAAKVMVNAIYKRKREFTFTGHGKIAGFLGRHVPGLVHFVVTRSAVSYKRTETPAADESS